MARTDRVNKGQSMEKNTRHAPSEKILDRKSLQTIYFAFIRPLLEYADVVLENCTNYESNELEKIKMKLLAS